MTSMCRLEKIEHISALQKVLEVHWFSQCTAEEGAVVEIGSSQQLGPIVEEHWALTEGELHQCTYEAGLILFVARHTLLFVADR